MSAYLLLNILIIFFPLVLSFEKKISFYKKFFPLLISIIITGIIFIVWDSVAVTRNDWSFNGEFVSAIKIFNLPPEEILFFVTVPYSIIFTFVSIRYYVKEKIIFIPSALIYFVSLVLIISAVTFSGKYYTFTVSLFSGILISFLNYFYRNFIMSYIFIVTLFISYIPFLIVNYILTSLPVVVYNPSAITGLRFLTIPAEDFLYSFSMITMWIFIFQVFEKYFLKRHNNDLSKT
ncbi:MAG: lycopene cyclase domain-containing protein [Ignavibacteria bacterium]|nr:lycopene cyclase domain-containing protein [Ignavibacteria bacterium]